MSEIASVRKVATQVRQSWRAARRESASVATSSRYFQ